MRTRFLLTTLLLLTCLSARADSVALTSFTGGTAYKSVYGLSNTVGWTFQVAADLTVTELGLYDPTSYGAPLTASHQVGLWDSAGNLLASTTVTPTAAETDGSLFTPVTPVSLLVGDTYTLGAAFTALDDDYVTSTATRTTDPAITYLEGVYINSVALAQPSLGGPTVDGRFGPNFQFTQNQTAAPTLTPEPPSLWLLGTGLLCAAAWFAARRDAARCKLAPELGAG